MRRASLFAIAWLCTLGACRCEPSPPAEPGAARPAVTATASVGQTAPAPTTAPSAAAEAEEPSEDAPPDGTMFVTARPLDIAIYLPTKPAQALVAPTAALVRSKFAKFKVTTDGKAADAPSVNIVAADAKTSALVPEVTRVRGLDEAQSKAAFEAKGVLVFAWAMDEDARFERMRAALALVADVADKNGGFIWDNETRELFTPGTWRKARVEGWEGDVPNAQQHIAVHYYRDAQRHRAVTLGMAKLGLPDLVAEDVPPEQSEAMTAAMGLTAQLLAEGANVVSGKLTLDPAAIHHAGARAELKTATEAGAKGGVPVTLLIAKQEEGDAENRLLELHFNGQPGATKLERQAGGLAKLTGRTGRKEQAK